MSTQNAEKDPRACVLAAIDEAIARFAREGFAFVDNDVTEGRRRDATPEKPHHWCGAFVSYILERCFGPLSFLNRKSVRGTWRVGADLSSVSEAAQRVGASSREIGVPGDILILDRPLGGHICFQYGPRARGEAYATGDGNGPGGGIAINRRLGTDEPLATIDLARLVQAYDTRNVGAETFVLEEVSVEELRPGDRFIRREDLTRGAWRIA